MLHRILSITHIPGQAPILHSLVFSVSPAQSFPPNCGAGESHILVPILLPIPHETLHTPYVHSPNCPFTNQSERNIDSFAMSKADLSVLWKREYKYSANSCSLHWEVMIAWRKLYPNTWRICAWKHNTTSFRCYEAKLIAVTKVLWSAGGILLPSMMVELQNW